LLLTLFTIEKRYVAIYSRTGGTNDMLDLGKYGQGTGRLTV